MSEENRLERLEALAEQILAGLEQTRQITESNTRSIEALTNTIREERQEWQLDRSRLYQALSEIATAQANFYSIQANFHNRLEELDKRQRDIVEILNILTTLVNKSN